LFKLYRVVDVVRVPPEKFSKPLEEAVYEELRRIYEGLISEEYGLIISIIDVDVDPVGRIYLGDPASYHRVEFTMLTFNPFIKEVVEGEVANIQSHGVFLNIGCTNGYIHVSQITDERAEYDPTRPALLLKSPTGIIEKNDVLRARIYSLKMDSARGIRIHMTIKQPGLGKVSHGK